MIVDVRPIRMGSYNEGMVTLSKPLGQLLANRVGFFRRDLSGLEGLPNLIGNHIPLVPPPGDMLILTLRQQELLICGHGIALVGGDKLPLGRFFWVLDIICPVTQALSNALALVNVQCNQSCGSQIISLPSYRKREPDQQVKLPLFLFISFLPVE